MVSFFFLLFFYYVSKIELIESEQKLDSAMCHLLCSVDISYSEMNITHYCYYSSKHGQCLKSTTQDLNI